MATIIDKRYKGDRSTVNKKKFFIRYRRFIKDQLDTLITNGVLKDATKGANKGRAIKIGKASLAEPSFHFSNVRGVHNKIWVNNPGYVVGDRVKLPKGQGQGNGATGGGDGNEEDQTFLLTNEEFQDLLFSHLELPHFTKTAFGSELRKVRCRAGFSKTGSQSNLNLKKTFEHSLARRIALDDIEAKKFPFIDDLDLRYNYFNLQDKPLAQAVLFCILDVSGSMTYEHKLRAKQFYYLMATFLRRTYKAVSIVFIIHTETAKEVSSEEFFGSRESGGTVISSGLELMQRIIKERFPPSEWNIYGVQATDGDNEYADNTLVREFLIQILPIMQQMICMFVKPNYHSTYLHRMYAVYKDLEKQFKHLRIANVETVSDIGKAFYAFFNEDKK